MLPAPNEELARDVGAICGEDLRETHGSESCHKLRVNLVCSTQLARLPFPIPDCRADIAQNIACSVSVCLLMSLHGPQPKWALVVGTSAIEGEPETGFRCCERRLRPRADLSWRPIHFGGYVIMAPSVSTVDGGRNVAGEYLVAETLDYLHFAEAPVRGLQVGYSPIPKQELLPR